MIRSKVRTIEHISPQAKKFMLQMRRRQNSGSTVTIGVHEDAGAYTDGKTNPLVAEVAMWNEFGTRNIPERSFMCAALDDNIALVNRWREEMLNNMATQGWDEAKCLEAIGFRIMTLIQNKIKSHVPPPNAPGTIAAKERDGVGSDTLIWTGLMLRSISYRVNLK